MKDKIISLLLSLVLMLAIATCFIPDSKTPPKPKSILEAPIVQTIQAIIDWIAGGGGSSGVDLRPKPDGN